MIKHGFAIANWGSVIAANVVGAATERWGVVGIAYLCWASALTLGYFLGGEYAMSLRQARRQ